MEKEIIVTYFWFSAQKELGPEDSSFLATEDSTPDVDIKMSHCVDDALEIMTHAKVKQYHTIIGEILFISCIYCHSVFSLFFFNLFSPFFFVLILCFCPFFSTIIPTLSSFFSTILPILSSPSSYLLHSCFLLTLFFLIGWSLGAQAALSLCSGTPTATQNLFLLNPSTGSEAKAFKIGTPSYTIFATLLFLFFHVWFVLSTWVIN